MNRRKRRKCRWLAAAVALMLTGCSGAPDTLENTEWKITALTAPDGTKYDEASYDTIIGATYYRFGTAGQMSCQVGNAQPDTDVYTYTYEEGKLQIRGADIVCNGTVKKEEIRLTLGEKGLAVLTEVLQ